MWATAACAGATKPRYDNSMSTGLLDEQTGAVCTVDCGPRRRNRRLGGVSRRGRSWSTGTAPRTAVGEVAHCIDHHLQLPLPAASDWMVGRVQVLASHSIG